MALKLALLDSATTAGTYGPVMWPGGDGYFMAYGTFDSGTVQLQAQILDGAPVTFNLSDALTADTLIQFSCPPCELYADVVGAGTMDLNAYAFTK